VQRRSSTRSRRAKQNARSGNRIGVAGASVNELEELYRREYERFARVAAAIAGDLEAGRDAVQDAFASLLRGRRSFRGDAPLEAWAWRAVLNAAKRVRTRGIDSLGEVADAPAPNGGAGEAAVVRRWIAALPERQRLAIFLRYYADLDYRSIAAAADIEVGTVSATLSSAHAALRKQLEVRR
jgi:RNA polymerase sigma factor (sigma-70 family)